MTLTAIHVDLLRGTMDKNILCVIIFSWGLFSIFPLNAQQQLVFGYSGEDHPHNIINKRILEDAYQRIGIEIVAKKLPRLRALYQSNRGETDGELFRSGNAQIEKSFPNLIKIPIILNYGEFVVFTRDVDFEVSGWESLRPYKIGSQIGVSVIDNGTKGMQVERVIHGEQLMKKLALGRVDIAVFPRLFGLMHLKNLTQKGFNNMSFKDIRILEPPITQDPLYHYLNNKHQKLVPEITTVLFKMKRDGEIQEIINSILLQHYIDIYGNEN